eukprot:510061_1
MYFAGKELKNEMNDTSLADLKLKTGAVVISGLRTDPRKQTQIMVFDEMVPGCIRVFKSIFTRYADGEKGTSMSRVAFAEYITSCGAEMASPQRLEQIFREFGEAGDYDWISFTGFLDFYKEAAQNRPHSVWKDIYSHGFDVVFRVIEIGRKEDAERKNAHLDSLPGNILAETPEYFQILFDALNTPAVAQTVWRLLMRIPTNPDRHNALQQLQCGQGEKPDWEGLVDAKSPFRLIYSLQIIENLQTASAESSDVSQPIPEPVSSPPSYNNLQPGIPSDSDSDTSSSMEAKPVGTVGSGDCDKVVTSQSSHSVGEPDHPEFSANGSKSDTVIDSTVFSQGATSDCNSASSNDESSPENSTTLESQPEKLSGVLWRVRFLERGGFDHLYSVLMKPKLEFNHSDIPG